MGPGPLLRSTARFVPRARSSFRRLASLVLLAALVVLSNLAFAQSAPNFAGDYAGMLGPLHVKLHLTKAADGTFSCAVDSPDQNMVGLACADVHVNGQSLSYTVPTVQGTYTGLLSSDGASLTGVWSQGTPTPLTLTRVTAATAAGAAAASAPAAPTPNAEVKWDDYTYKFDRSGLMAQVFEGGKVVGTILNMNGQQRILPLPGTDSAKMTKSFEDYQAFSARSHAGSTSAAATTPAPNAATTTAATTPSTSTFTPPASRGSFQVTASPTPEADIRIDQATHTITVPRPDGITITFVGEDVKIAGFRKLNYIVRHQKGSTGRFLEHSLGHADSAGGSLSGGGEEFLLDGGGLIYDSGMGTNADMQVNSPVLTAKQLSQIAVAAVADVRQVPGHENFAPPGYNTLKEISQYRLRSDGSR
jgi:hypothetical protein